MLWHGSLSFWEWCFGYQRLRNGPSNYPVNGASLRYVSALNLQKCQWVFQYCLEINIVDLPGKWNEQGEAKNSIRVAWKHQIYTVCNYNFKWLRGLGISNRVNNFVRNTLKKQQLNVALMPGSDCAISPWFWHDPFLCRVSCWFVKENGCWDARINRFFLYSVS